MYDVYDIIDLFGTNYFTYDCPEGSIPFLRVSSAKRYQLENPTVWIIIKDILGDTIVNMMTFSNMSEIIFHQGGRNAEVVDLEFLLPCSFASGCPRTSFTIDLRKLEDPNTSLTVVILDGCEKKEEHTLQRHVNDSEKQDWW